MSIESKLAKLEEFIAFFQAQHIAILSIRNFGRNKTLIPYNTIYCSADNSIYYTTGFPSVLQERWLNFLAFYRSIFNYSRYGVTANNISMFAPFVYKTYDCSWLQGVIYRSVDNYNWKRPLPLIEESDQRISLYTQKNSWETGNGNYSEISTRHTPNTNMPACLASDFLDKCIAAVGSIVYEWGFIDCYKKRITVNRKAYVNESKTATGTFETLEVSEYRIPDAHWGTDPYYSYRNTVEFFYASSITYTYSSEDVEYETEQDEISYHEYDLRFYDNFDNDIEKSYWRDEKKKRFVLETSIPERNTSFQTRNYYPDSVKSFPQGYCTRDAGPGTLTSFMFEGETKENYSKILTGKRGGVYFYNPYPFDIEIRIRTQTIPGKLDSEPLSGFRDKLYLSHVLGRPCEETKQNSGRFSLSFDVGIERESLIGDNELDCDFNIQITHHRYKYKQSTTTTTESGTYYDPDTETDKPYTDTIIRKDYSLDAPTLAIDLGVPEYMVSSYYLPNNEIFSASGLSNPISNLEYCEEIIELASGEETEWFPTEFIPYDGTYNYYERKGMYIQTVAWIDCRIKIPEN